MKLLDSTFERERQGLIEEIRQKQPRLVPSNKEHNYRYLIYKETIDDAFTLLHLVRRNKKTFRRHQTKILKKLSKIISHEMIMASMDVALQFETID